MDAILYRNGRFWLPGLPEPHPSALLASAGRVLALGAEAESRAAAESRGESIDLRGQTAIPGPVDAHCHLVSYGMIRLREADLRGARSLAEIASRLEEQAARQRLRPGEGRWLLGRGFDQELLEVRRWPSRQDLDRISPEISLRITRVCGHAVVANTLALQAAGLDSAAREGDLPEGVLTEERIGPIYHAVPEPAGEEWSAAAEWACCEAARVGFVGVHSLMAHNREVRALLDLRRVGPLPVRVRMQLPFAMLQNAASVGLRTGFGDDWLRIGAIKLFSDGSLGARTAALRAPYSDDPATAGELIYPPGELARRVRAVREAGFQVCIHAIGDRAMEATLDAIASASEEAPWAFPPRIEHASLVDSGIVRRMRELGVGAAIQPQFARSDSWAPGRLGAERARGCYAFRTLWEAGVPLAGSTDCPVEALHALAALGQLVHRPDWSPEEGLPLESAVRVFSEGAYRIDGDTGGRLAPGDFADFVVLEEDPRAVRPEEVEKIPVAMTVVGGAVSFEA